VGIAALREIDESVNRRKGSEKSHVFHGRDVYAYTGARLAGGIIGFDGVGPELDPGSIVCHPTPDPVVTGSRVDGMIDIQDPHFGMVWTNIPIEVFEDLGIGFGSFVDIVIRHKGQIKYTNRVLYGKSFGAVAPGEDILYNNEIGYFALGNNMNSFVRKHGVLSGFDWTISLVKT
jgi:hypothetical protein